MAKITFAQLRMQNRAMSIETSQHTLGALNSNSADAPLNCYLLPMQDAQVEYYPNWLSAKHASHLMQYFVEKLQWYQPTVSLYGKEMKIPRLQAWYGEPDTQYEYSKHEMHPLPWDKRLFKLKQACENVCGAQFNSVLANFYRNGNDSMGMHADDEPELGEQAIIASVSLGQARRFTFKHKASKESQRVLLEHGSLLIMKGNTQQYWQHGINKSKTHIGARLNFTFRWVIPSKLR